MGGTSQPGVTVFRFADDFEAFSAGQAIFSTGQPGEMMYVVKEGEVEVIINGKVIDTVGPGGIIGEMALIDKRPRSATAVAKTDCKLVSVNEQRFQRLVQQTPHFALQVMKIMAQRLRQMDAQA
ncbi:MAG TPA: cyclic nucleotide-binding domain-containing protein [Candidatus Margulisiibacteriota bacterium]|nr:cyclic nucleotide-binding domain-containing protein [Candidatus Margulisiibacteriota bacterium]